MSAPRCVCGEPATAELFQETFVTVGAWQVAPLEPLCAACFCAAEIVKVELPSAKLHLRPTVTGPPLAERLREIAAAAVAARQRARFLATLAGTPLAEALAELVVSYCADAPEDLVGCKVKPRSVLNYMLEVSAVARTEEMPVQCDRAQDAGESCGRGAFSITARGISDDRVYVCDACMAVCLARFAINAPLEFAWLPNWSSAFYVPFAGRDPTLASLYRFGRSYQFPVPRPGW